MGGIFFYYLYLILVWGLVRRFVVLPEVIEELWLKPIIWLVPLMLWNFSLKKRIVMLDSVNWVKSLFFGLMVGVFYVFALNGFRFDSINLEANYFGIALSVAMTEEIVFSGFIFGFLTKHKKNKLQALVLTSVLAACSHVPMMLFGYSLDTRELLPALLFVFGYSLINISIRAVTGNVLGSIVARALLVLSIV